MIPLPDAFISRMNRQLGNELPDFLHALSLLPVRGIRMNAMKPFSGMETYTAGPRIPWAEDGYILDESSTAGATVFHEAGAFYIQEPTAMLPAEIMDVRPGELILDLCAAPGGKSTQMALKLRGEGLIICNEPVLKRAQILSRNIERTGIPNSIVTCAYPSSLPHTWDGIFDGVLVDAPCSGEGMFRRNPEARSEWTEEKSCGCAVRQAEIIREAARFVRPGGRIVYSTCTYNPAENEEIVNLFLQEHSDFSTEAFRLPCADGSNGFFLCLPHRVAGEGQFAAKLRKAGKSSPPQLLRPFPGPSGVELSMFREQLPDLPVPDARFGNMLIRIPQTPELKGIRILRAGLNLAEVRGKYIFPDHAAAMTIQPIETIRTELSAAEACFFIAGHEIPGSTKGWTLMKYRGLYLGWGKGSNGLIKNHYPKGLRKADILTEP